tara:strand:+ start:73 stop:729 length:657 start_codon:yes stop_codon:yes gene_type:complete
MKLYVNGCSFSYGNNLDNKSAWPDFMKDYDVINESWIGSSNKRILRRTIEYIETHAYDDTFFVIQLSDWFRDEWYDAEFDTWIGMCKNDVVLDDRSYNRSDINQTELNVKVKNFIQHSILHRSIKTVEQETFNLLNTAIAYFNQNDVNYLFTGMSSRCMPHDNHVNIITPGHFVKPISIVAGNNIISTSDSHPNEAGHKLFARYILNEIKNYERYPEL